MIGPLATSSAGLATRGFETAIRPETANGGARSAGQNGPSTAVGSDNNSPAAVSVEGREQPAGPQTPSSPDVEGAQDTGLQPAQRTQQSAPTQLTEQELKVVRELAARDREVRAHEQAHAAVGGRYAGAPTYDLQRGPDGRQYAVGGQVSIDTSAVPGDPAATIAKARIVRRAALAPAQPSSQDRAVAAAATAMEQQAKAQLLAEKSPDLQTASSEDSPDNSNAPSGATTSSTETADTQSADLASLLTYRPIDTRA